MSLFLGFNQNRVVAIVIGIIGIYIATTLNGEGFYSYLHTTLLIASILPIFCTVVVIIYEFMKYLYHYKKYVKLKNDWNRELLVTHLSNLEAHYNKYLNKNIYFYIPYRNMIEEVKTVLERT